MKKFITLFAIVAAFAMINSCGSSKKAVAAQDYTVEEVEVYGYGIGKSEDENTARNTAITVALGELSTKLQANVRTASSNYQKQNGSQNKTLFESLTEVVSQNRLQGVKFEGDRKPASHIGKIYEYRVTARVDQVLLRKSIETALNELDVTEEDRAAFKAEMFGE